MLEGIEGSLFESWEELLEDQLSRFQFSGAVLKNELSGIAAGTKIPVVEINFDASEMVFYGEDNKPYARFKLGLVVLSSERA